VRSGTEDDGSPGNAHTICVGSDAVPAHVAYGDFLGVLVFDRRGGRVAAAA